MNNNLDLLLSWVNICVVSFSPWLFHKGPNYTVVDEVTLLCSAQQIKENIEEKFGNIIRTDKSRYNLWMKECGFMFS